MSEKNSATVLMFGRFYTLQKQRGLSPEIELPLGPEGRTAAEIVSDMNLAPEMIGAVYCNHRCADLTQVIRPGDRVAFVPGSVPGPHKCFPGLPDLEKLPAKKPSPRTRGLVAPYGVAVAPASI